ncbi:MAG TPA: response regulator [Jatrophihabitans sp.]|nr:response regulator [Jatrophihabitans sp.]
MIRVLVVDDDYRVAAIHAAYVAKTDGFAVAGQAHSATAAVQAVAELQPDLVLLDVYLPDGDGLAVARTLLDAATHPDVIVITAARDVDTVRAAMQLGALHYLVKPFGYAALRERLESYRRLRARVADLTQEADQAEVDELFNLLRRPGVLARRPEKGHSAPTLELVRAAVASAPGDVSAAEVGELIGISRATAQRYLTYLERHGIVRMQLRYGSTGRPEHRYLPAG